MEPGAGICVPPEVYNRLMYCKPTQHYKISAEKYIHIQQELAAEEAIRSNGDFIPDSTTPIQTNLDMGQEDIPPSQDVPDLKSMYNSMIAKLNELGIKHEGLTMKPIIEIIDSNIIDLSGPTRRMD